MAVSRADDLIPSLFRSEYGKIVAVLVKTFGLQNVEIAQDIASDTFLKATESWGIKGIPDQPRAWLYAVAKNKTKDHLKRLDTFYDKVIPAVKLESSHSSESMIDFSDESISDSQLKMIFAICSPQLQVDAQLTMALRLLCGFNIDEISNALLSARSTIHKRLVRAKEKFRQADIPLELPPTNDIKTRISSVLRVLYLLFNEGYFSTVNDKKIRKDLCFEAMRLGMILTQNSLTAVSDTYALMAIFCFHTSRFEARISEGGEQILYSDQDRTLWNDELITKGQIYLTKTSKEDFENKYFLEAHIAYWHTKKDVDETEKWKFILGFYDRLIHVESSPIIKLNRAYAISMVHGNEAAIAELQNVELTDHMLYHSLLANLHHEPADKIAHYQRAISLSTSPSDRMLLQNKIQQLQS